MSVFGHIFVTNFNKGIYSLSIRVFNSRHLPFMNEVFDNHLHRNIGFLNSIAEKSLSSIKNSELLPTFFLLTEIYKKKREFRESEVESEIDKIDTFKKLFEYIYQEQDSETYLRLFWGAF